MSRSRRSPPGIELTAAALLGTAAAVWLWRRRWQDALAAAAMGGASGVAALSLVTLVLQHGLGTGSLLPLAPPLIIAGSVGLGAAAALTTDDYRAAAPAASILAWAVLGGPGPRSLVLGLGASAWLVSLARNMIVDG